MSRRSANPKQPTAVKLPFSPKTAWRMIVGGFVGLGVLAAGIWAVAAGLPRAAMLGTATAASEAGFVIRQVSIEGATNQPRLSIYREVLDGGSDSIMLADLPAIRARLVELPWVKDASIQRRWPDRLEVNITERAPAAVWQWRGKLRLIDNEGVVLPADDLGAFSSLPLLVGEGARDHAAALLRLMSAEPALAEEMQAALWVGRRRWDIRMKSGETISLPEGPAAEAAILRFAALNRDTPMLGRGFVRFDLRLPDKMVVRVGGEPGQPVKPRPEPKPKAPAPEVQSAPPVVAPPIARPMAASMVPMPREVSI